MPHVHRMSLTCKHVSSIRNTHIVIVHFNNCAQILGKSNLQCSIIFNGSKQFALSKTQNLMNMKINGFSEVVDLDFTSPIGPDCVIACSAYLYDTQLCTFVLKPTSTGHLTETHDISLKSMIHYQKSMYLHAC